MNRCASSGYTLIELLMVVAILSIVAVIALPVTQRVTESGADIAVDEVAQMLRFARDDARRKGRPRLIRCDPVNGKLTVKEVVSDKDTSSEPNEAIRRPDTYPPADYVVTPGAASAGSAMDLVSCSFTFVDNATASTVVFDVAGNPVRGLGKGPVREKALRAGAIVLGAGHVRRSVHLNVTGRITQS